LEGYAVTRYYDKDIVRRNARIAALENQVANLREALLTAVRYLPTDVKAALYDPLCESAESDLWKIREAMK
jgi:hypothetical protein